jgi:cation diffusion facilitator CzcD-associated flavoprotein CzcO
VACFVYRFPSTWPVYCPAGKLANWLEYYAEAMELPVWTSTIATSASQDSQNLWHVTVERADGNKRTLTVKHLIFATGFSGSTYQLPKIPGLVNFLLNSLNPTLY